MDKKTMAPQTEKSGRSDKRARKKICNSILSLVLTLIVCAAVIVEFLALSEYRPDDTEEVSVFSLNREPVSIGEELTVLTWNCGYGALGDNADYYADGGQKVYTADSERVLNNLQGLTEEAGKADPDVIFFQEIDRDSARSRHIDEMITMNNEFSDLYDTEYMSAFACDFKVSFVPYPVPPIGKVESGLLTFCSREADSAERIRLPCPYKWPSRLSNPKRCLLLERIPLQNSEQFLVLINLHPDAGGSEEIRREQIKMLTGIIEEETEAGNYVIAGGSFNGTFSNTDISAYPVQDGMREPEIIDTSESGSGLQYIMDSSVPTRRSLDQPYAGADKENFQYYVTDGFIVSSNIEVKSCTTLDKGFVYTDHNPVLMKCVLK